MSSDNPTSGDNQQETRDKRILRDCTPSASTDAMIQSDPYGDIGSRAEMSRPPRQRAAGVTTMPKVEPRSCGGVLPLHSATSESAAGYMLGTP